MRMRSAISVQTHSIFYIHASLCRVYQMASHVYCAAVHLAALSLRFSNRPKQRETCFCVDVARENACISCNRATTAESREVCFGVHDRVRGGHMKRDNRNRAICHTAHRESLSLSVAAQPCWFWSVDGKHERKLSPRAASSSSSAVGRDLLLGRRELYIPCGQSCVISA
jgi:hypothetical protein